MTTTNKRRAMTIGEKMKIIERREGGASNKAISKELLIKPSTVSSIWKCRNQIKQLFQKNITSSKKIKSSQYKDVENALLEWYKIQRSKNAHINIRILQNKATELGRMLNKPNFECTASWVSRFRHRHNLTFGKITDEAATLPAEVLEINWQENVWPATLQHQFSDSDICNVDETEIIQKVEINDDTMPALQHQFPDSDICNADETDVIEKIEINKTMPTTSKRRAMTIGEKIEIIERMESGALNKDISKELLLKPSTVSSIWRSRNQLKQVFRKNNTSSKKIKSSQYKDVEDALLEWYKIQRSNNIPVNGPILQDKATQFGKMLNRQNFECSSAWVSRFQKRHNIAFGKMSSKAATDAAELSEINWLENIWPTLRQKFSDSEIYNADETGLFFRLTPDQIFRYRGEKCQEGQLAKDRLTVLVASNMTGSDKNTLLVIGKSKSCFKHVKNLPVTYKRNKKAWMTIDIFTEWLHDWDDQLTKENRKILLTVDNCPSHMIVPNLKNITVVSLPSNTITLLQPMNHGIIEALKVEFRNRQLLKIINREEQDKNTKISELDAVILLADAWKDLTADTIKKCFSHSGFMPTIKDERIDEEDPLLVNLEDPCNNLNPELMNFAEIDKCLITYGTPSDEEIVRLITNPDEDESSDEEEPEEEISISEVFFSVNQVRTYLCFNKEIDTPEISTALQKIENHMRKEYYASKCQQTRITDYFFKEKSEVNSS